VMSSAFVKACATLGLKDRADPITELLAQHIIEAAQRGLRNETALCLTVLQSSNLTHNRPPEFGAGQLSTELAACALAHELASRGYATRLGSVPSVTSGAARSTPSFSHMIAISSSCSRCSRVTQVLLGAPMV
jgi:hypothetical protein